MQNCTSACNATSTKFMRMFRITFVAFVERSSSAVECRTRNQESPSSNPALLPFRRLGIFVLSIDALVDAAV